MRTYVQIDIFVTVMILGSFKLIFSMDKVQNGLHDNEIIRACT